MSEGNTLSDNAAMAMAPRGSISVNPLPDRVDNPVPDLGGYEDYAHTIGAGGSPATRPRQSAV